MKNKANYWRSSLTMLFREVDGIKVSFGQRVVQDKIVIVLKHTELKNNIAVDDAIFRPPKMIQID